MIQHHLDNRPRVPGAQPSRRFATFCASGRRVVAQLDEHDLRVAWIVTLGLLLPVNWHWIGNVRLGISDLVLAFFGLRALFKLRQLKFGSFERLPYARWLLALTIIVVVMGTLGAKLRLGYLPRWTVVNRDLGTFLMLGSWFLVASAPSEPNVVFKFLRWFVIAGSIVNAVGLAGASLRYFWDVPNPLMFMGGSLRLVGTMVNPNSYGGYLSAVLAVQLSTFVLRERIFGFPRWIEAANCVALLVGILLTISRGSWLAALAGAVVAMLATTAVANRRGLTLRNLAAPAFVSAVLLVVLVLAKAGGTWMDTRAWGNTAHYTPESRIGVYMPHGPPSLSEFFRIASDPYGFADRMVINETALKIYLQSPRSWLFGIGLGSFLDESPRTALRKRLLIHSTYLWALVELGLVGLVIMVGMLCSMFYGIVASLTKNPRVDPAAAASLAALASMLVWFLSTDGLFTRHVWFILALVSLQVRVGPRPIQSKPHDVGKP